jgi:hypothetical protein
MKSRILMAFVLASGMALAQTGGSTGSTDQNQSPQGTQNQTGTQDQQQPQPAAPSTQSNPSTQSDQTAPVNSPNSQDAVLRGCLKQSGGNWVVSSNGQDTPLSGDTSMLGSHNGQEVEVHGIQSAGGVMQVTSVNTVSDACSSGGNQAANAGATAEQNAASTAAAAGGAIGAAGRHRL